MLHEDTRVAGFGLADVRPAAARRAFEYQMSPDLMLHERTRGAASGQRMSGPSLRTGW